MNKELTLQLQKDFPQIFADLYGNPRETCMAFGIEHGDGWHDLIRKLCADIMAVEPGPNFKAAQVKEKFGGLRFYVEGWPEDDVKSKEIGRLIGEAEAESFNICEVCGSRENITVEGSWIRALCGTHRAEVKAAEQKRHEEYLAAEAERKGRLAQG